MYGDVSLRPRFALVFANHYVIYVISKKKKKAVSTILICTYDFSLVSHVGTTHIFFESSRDRDSLFIHLRWMDESSKAHTRGKRAPVNKKKKKKLEKRKKDIGIEIVNKTVRREEYGK